MPTMSQRGAAGCDDGADSVAGFIAEWLIARGGNRCPEQHHCEYSSEYTERRPEFFRTVRMFNADGFTSN
jgi:hypothetical protein